MDSIAAKSQVNPSSQDFKEKSPGAPSGAGSTKRRSRKGSNRTSKEIEVPEDDVTDMLYLIDADTEAMCLHQMQCVNVVK